MRKFVSRENKVRAITAFHKKFESTLEKADATVDRVYKAFENPTNTYTKAQLSSIVTAFDKLTDSVVRGIKSSFVNLRVAVRGSIPTDRVVAHIEDGHTLLSKIAIMKAQALASIKAEDVTIDEAGYLVGDENEGADAEAPAADDGDENKEETPQDKIEDIKADLDELAAELGGGVDAEVPAEAEEPAMDEEPPVEEPKAASKKSTKRLTVKEAADTSPGKAPERISDQPKSNPELDKETMVSLEEKFEKSPSNKENLKKGSKAAKTIDDKDTSPGKAPERIPDQPKKNPDIEEEDLDDLVDDFEKSPSDPENLEMEDSMIDDAVNVEILSNGDTDELEEEVTKASASLRDRKIASSKKSNSSDSENDVLKTIISDMF